MNLIEMKSPGDIYCAELYSCFKFMPKEDYKRLVKAFSMAVFFSVLDRLLRINRSKKK